MSRTWWVATVFAGVVGVGAATSERAQACLLGACDSIIIANQVTQITQMVAQLQELVEQVQTLEGIVALSDELVTSNDPGMGNIGRLREVFDLKWEMEQNGVGLSTTGATEGAFSQRDPGVTDQPGWLDAMAAAEAPLVSEQIGGWGVTDPNGQAVVRDLEQMADGSRSLQELWGDLEANGPGVLTPAEVQGLSSDAAAQRRLLAAHAAAEALAAARLVYVHAQGEATAGLAALADGVQRNVLRPLRGDDLMRVQRIEQAQAMVNVVQTELLVAEAQRAAYRATEETVAAYEAELARRAARARWAADLRLARQRGDQWMVEVQAGATDVVAAHRYYPGW